MYMYFLNYCIVFILFLFYNCYISFRLKLLDPSKATSLCYLVLFHCQIKLQQDSLRGILFLSRLLFIVLIICIRIFSMIYMLFRLHLHLAAAWLGTLKKYRTAILDVVVTLHKELSSKMVKTKFVISFVIPGNNFTNFGNIVLI